MRVAVVGLWHLGSVYAACLAKAGHDVLAYDPDHDTVNALLKGQPPIFEPGLEALLNEGQKANRLHFSANPKDLHDSNIVWVTFDTPVDNNDVADVPLVIKEVEGLLPHLQDNALVIMSSQVPVGTTNQLQAHADTAFPNKHITFACMPENLRLGKAIDVFTHPDRIVIGLDNPSYKPQLETLLKPFTEKLIWMSVVSAEMTKHAINAFLAVSVTFINEIAALCETVGANGREVEMGLKSEERIGPKAYLRPGDAIAGGTLMRDIHYLTQLGEAKNRDTFLMSAIVESNHYHKQWSCRKVASLLQNLQGKTIAMLGLTYKAGTDTLRRSTAIETCEWLHQQGITVQAFDPTITALPAPYSGFIQLQSSAKDALAAADAVVVSTEWPEFRDLTADEFIASLKRPLVIDPSGFIAKNIGADARIEYFSVGVPS
ncbi:MAG: nucleotide sugar dehydrogenase [Gammaproteobacteria bacterium]|nr:nucleotide sugar dehydrogenase [Gammaproteobacteria bacterium]